MNKFDPVMGPFECEELSGKQWFAALSATKAFVDGKEIDPRRISLGDPENNRPCMPLELHIGAAVAQAALYSVAANARRKCLTRMLKVVFKTPGYSSKMFCRKFMDIEYIKGFAPMFVEMRFGKPSWLEKLFGKKEKTYEYDGSVRWLDDEEVEVIEAENDVYILRSHCFID
jgi:hypothetical protein